MKHYFLPLLFLSNIAFAQTNIVLQPHYEDGNNTYLRDFNPTSPAIGAVDLTSYVWTCDGDPCVGRAFFTFDLSSINVGAIVENATLFLYANTTTTLGFGGTEPHTGVNASHLFRVTEENYHPLATSSPRLSAAPSNLPFGYTKMASTRPMASRPVIL
jgi:hypothetical protein